MYEQNRFDWLHGKASQVSIHITTETTAEEQHAEFQEQNLQHLDNKGPCGGSLVLWIFCLNNFKNFKLIFFIGRGKKPGEFRPQQFPALTEGFAEWIPGA